MSYQTKEVVSEVVFAFFIGVFFLLLGIGACWAADKQMPGYDIPEGCYQFFLVLFLICGLAVFEPSLCDSRIQVFSHGWTRKILAITGSNLAFATPFAIAIWAV